MKFGLPLYSARPLHIAGDFVRSESLSLRSPSALGCRTLGRSRPWLAGLVPLMGSSSLCNITVPLAFVVGQNGLAMAGLSVVASPLAILPLPPSLFSPLALYCLFSWHLTASNPLRLAPYCYSPAGTLLRLLHLIPPISGLLLGYA